MKIDIITKKGVREIIKEMAKMEVGKINLDFEALRLKQQQLEERIFILENVQTTKKM